MKLGWVHIAATSLALASGLVILGAINAVRSPAYVGNPVQTAEPDKVREVVPPPPLPWFVDAYIGFELIPELTAGGTWYYQNALQIDGLTVRLHQQTVICKEGRLYSTEGDGGSMSYKGRLSDRSQGAATLTFLECDGCIRPLPHSKAFGKFELPYSVLSASAVKLGEVTYHKNADPYSDKCPSTGT